MRNQRHETGEGKATAYVCVNFAVVPTNDPSVLRLATKRATVAPARREGSMLMGGREQGESSRVARIEFSSAAACFCLSRFFCLRGAAMRWDLDYDEIWRCSTTSRANLRLSIFSGPGQRQQSSAP